MYFQICNLQFLLSCCVVSVTIYVIIFSLKTSNFSPMKFSVPHQPSLLWLQRNKNYAEGKAISGNSVSSSPATSRKQATPIRITENVYYNNSFEIKLNSQEYTVFTKNDRESVKQMNVSVRNSLLARRKVQYNQSSQSQVIEHENKLQLSQYQKIKKIKIVNGMTLPPFSDQNKLHKNISGSIASKLTKGSLKSNTGVKFVDLSQVKENLTQNASNLFNSTRSVEKNLKHISISLYEISKAILEMHNCSNQSKQYPLDSQNLLLCNSKSIAKTPSIVMITSMYHHTGKQFIFRNTLQNWSNLKPFIQPVLYISDFKIIEKSGDLVDEACSLGWVVSFAPVCNSDGYPVLVDMITHSLTFWPDARWVGFSNGDILFNLDIIETVKYLETSQLIPQLLVARRWNVFVSTVPQ